MSNSPEAPVTRQHVASFTHPSSFREFLSTYGPRFALCLLGVVTLRLWIQCDLYDRYSSTDFGAITVMGTFVRVAAMLLIIMIGGRAGLSTRAQRVMDVLSCVLMTMASALYLLQYSFPGAPLSLPASLLASLGIAWAGVMWIRVFVRMEPGEAFLYSFVCIALSAVLGFVLGLMDGSMAYAFCIFLPLCSYLTCVQAHKTLDALDGPRDESRPDRHAATLVGEQGEGAVRMRDFVLPLAGLALLNLALGLSRGFPDGSSISLPVEMQLVHQLGTALLALSYVWMVLVLGRRLTRVLFWGVPAAVMALGVVLVVTGTPDVIPLGGAFITISNSLFIGVLWYTAYELSRHSDVVPYAVFGVVWIAHLLPREAGRLMVFGLGPAVAATDSEVFLVLTITLLLAAGIALLLSDAGMGGVVLFPELRQRAAKPASAAAADPATAAPAPELATAAPELAPAAAAPATGVVVPAVSSATAVAADAAVLAAASAHESEPAPAPEPPSPLERLREAYGLTDREVQMAGYLAQGRTRAFIAGELYLSENTVKRHITTLYQKVGVHSKQDLIDLLQQQ